MDKNVLIVEDEAITALFLEHLVQEMGLDVCHVSDTGRDAVDYATKNPVDVILMDIRLKDDVDGITAAMTIQDLSIPVIFHSAYVDETTRARALSANPVAILEKPASPDVLKSTVSRAIGRA